jgi:Nucleotidyl transferase AbiEii toxin, Type IV TA system
MPRWRRPFHRALDRVFAALDGEFLLGAECYFGGGTLVALQLDEFRESRDVDFLCSSSQGFRELRQTVSERSLGRILRSPLALAREVRTDRDGIRTFFSIGDLKVKFELILEARIGLKGHKDAKLGIPVLDLDCLVAEKFLANADRGLDESVKSRDLIDLAFLAARHGAKALAPGFQQAESAYGSVVQRQLRLTLARFEDGPKLARACGAALGIDDLSALRRGLVALRKVVRQIEHTER